MLLMKKKLNENLFLVDTFFPEEEVATQLQQNFTETDRYVVIEEQHKNAGKHCYLDFFFM
jgi:hypothetical protein